MAKYHEIEKRVRSEALKLGSAFDTGELGDCSGLEYTEVVIRETMRLFAPEAQGVGKEMIRDYIYTRANDGKSIFKFPIKQPE